MAVRMTGFFFFSPTAKPRTSDAPALTELQSSSSLTHKAYTAFRYACPLTEEALDQMAQDGVARAVACTQYPQYSCSTTGSNLNELFRQVRARSSAGDNAIKRIEWSVIDRWPTHPGLVQAFTNCIRATLGALPLSPRERDAVPIRFSAHSLPMSIVSDRGDP